MEGNEEACTMCVIQCPFSGRVSRRQGSDRDMEIVVDSRGSQAEAKNAKVEAFCAFTKIDDRSTLDI